MTPQPARRPRAKRAIPNEVELLDCLARGWTRRQIAEEYGKPYARIVNRVSALVERVRAKSDDRLMYLFGAGKLQFDARGYVARVAD